MPGEMMEKKGVTLPPLHARCRSITVAYFETSSTINYGEKMSRQDKEFVNAWTPAEHKNFADGIKANSKNLKWRDMER